MRVIQKREIIRKTGGAIIIVRTMAPKRADVLRYKRSQMLIIEIRPIIPYCFAVSQDIEISHWRKGSNRLQEWQYPSTS